jgi:hypothetical protein
MARQVTADQHFVPRFYMKGFADNGFVQVLHLRKRRIGKARPYASVCYQPFFYAQKTGVQDEVSQHFEDLFGQFETQFAERYPKIVENARNKRLTDGNLDTLAYMMALQWMRSQRFRDMVRELESQVLKIQFQARAMSPTFIKTAKEIYKQHDIDLTDQQAEDLQRSIMEGNYEITSDNTSHLKFIMSKENLTSYKTWFYVKQWNVLSASRKYQFVTSDNPVAEWISPNAGLYGAHIAQRKHYFPLSPDIMIESVPPTRDVKTQPVDALAYRDCDDDDTLVCNMVMAHHAKEFLYSPTKDIFTELLRQQHQNDSAYRTFYDRYVREHAGAQAGSHRETP